MAEFSLVFETLPDGAGPTITLFGQEEEGRECLLSFDGIWTAKQETDPQDIEKLVESEFLIVVDRSGSMSGQPWTQVKEALLKLVAMVKSNEAVCVSSICYNHAVDPLHLDGTAMDNRRKLDSVRADGSTDFVKVFEHLGDRFKKMGKSSSQNRKSVFIFFMTDGCDTCNSEEKIMAAKEHLQMVIQDLGAEVIFHVLGFSAQHNPQFLESLTFLGTSDGSYSYVSPHDGGKALEEQLVKLVELTSAVAGSTLYIEAKSENVLFLDDWFGKYSRDVVLPALVNKKEGTVATKKFVKLTAIPDQPVLSLKIFERLTGGAEGEPAKVASVQIKEITEPPQIKEFQLKKLRAAVDLLTSKLAELDREEILKYRHEVSEKFKQIQVEESDGKRLGTLKAAIEAGLQIVDNALDEGKGETERMMYCQGGHTSYQAKSRGFAFPRQKKNREALANQNKYVSKATPARNQMQMKSCAVDYNLDDFEVVEHKK